MRALAVALVSAFVVSLMPCPAQAGLVIVPIGPMVPYGPFFYRPERYMAVDNQYFGVNVSGLNALCSQNPDLCDAPGQQDALQRLRSRRVAGITLLVTGIVAAVGGTVWTVASTRYDAYGYERTANYTPLAVGLGLGIVLPLTGGFIAPGTGDIIDFVNFGNRTHPDRPIQIHLGALPPAGRGLALSMQF